MPWYVSAWRRLCWCGVALVVVVVVVSLCVVCLVYIKDPKRIGSWRRLSVCRGNLVFFFDSLAMSSSLLVLCALCGVRLCKQSKAQQRPRAHQHLAHSAKLFWLTPIRQSLRDVSESLRVSKLAEVAKRRTRQTTVSFSKIQAAGFGEGEGERWGSFGLLLKKKTFPTNLTETFHTRININSRRRRRSA